MRRFVLCLLAAASAQAVVASKPGGEQVRAPVAVLRLVAAPRRAAACCALARIWLPCLLICADALAAPRRAPLRPALWRTPQALNVAAETSLAAVNVRALFSDWLSKFKRAYREGDEVRRRRGGCRSAAVHALTRSTPATSAALGGPGV